MKALFVRSLGGLGSDTLERRIKILVLIGGLNLARHRHEALVALRVG